LPFPASVSLVCEASSPACQREEAWWMCWRCCSQFCLYPLEIALIDGAPFSAHFSAPQSSDQTSFIMVNTQEATSSGAVSTSTGLPRCATHSRSMSSVDRHRGGSVKTYQRLFMSAVRQYLPVLVNVYAVYDCEEHVLRTTLAARDHARYERRFSST
jgi:hypothetical protein